MAANPTPRKTPENDRGPSRQLTRALGRALLTWYRKHRRDLPWRRSADPYAVWVSEVMLQQTQVATAVPYFNNWMRRFPDVATLAVAEEAQVLQAWQGLGYYSRARSLLSGARAVIQDHGGRVPSNISQLLAVPGVGPYTAGAIASIAYGKDEPVVDGNVTRVLSRLFMLGGDPLKSPLKAELWETARNLIPNGEARDFNQALMELGALCCTPKKPNCAGCPARRYCQAYGAGVVEQFPEPRARPKVTAIHVAAALLKRNDRVLLVQLPADALRWASMWQFPNLEHEPSQDGGISAERAAKEYCGMTIRVHEKLYELKHSVTRYRIHLAFYRAESISGRLRVRNCAAARWCSDQELSELALPAAHRRFARYISSH